MVHCMLDPHRTFPPGSGRTTGDCFMVKRAAFLMSATGRLAIGIILITAASIVSRMEIHGLQNVRRNAVVYLAITHKRDFDAIGPVLPILWARGRRAFVRDVRFAMRGDAFTP